MTAAPPPDPVRFPPDLVAAGIALHDNRLHDAEPLLKARLRADPYDVRAIRMLAELAFRIGRTRDAENLLRRAVELAPGWTTARAQLALVLGRTGRAAEALPLLDALFDAEPDDIGHHNLKAATLARLGDFDEAIRLYESVLAAAPDQPRVWLSYGHMLKTVGRQAEGIDAYRRAIALVPQLGEAWWSLANLKTVTFTEADRAAMTAALETPGLRDEDRFHLDFALGKAFHDLKDADRAFAHYTAANALRLVHQPWDGADLAAAVDKAIAVLTPDLLAAHAGDGAGDPDPIFIVGMPRAGSTLIEQILASHPLVEGTSELPDLPAVARARPGYPGSLRDMDGPMLAAAGADYLARAAVQRRTTRPRFIDKLPNNWLYIPFILLALPKATIIDARRHPLGCCVSNYRQHFARGQGFTYDLGDVGRYYADYVRLMAHVDSVAPGRVHRVIYEQMVADTEGQVRALLAHAGLDFDPACLAFWQTDRAVRTASSEQVRRPIYTDATDEWRRYDAHLAPLRAALGPLVEAYPAVPADAFAPRR